MNEQKKSSKSKVSWAIALIAVLAVLIGGGWWLWGKNLIKQPTTKPDDGNKVSTQPQVAKALPAPGGDEELLAEAEKIDSQATDTVEVNAKQPARMIKYKKRVIREFKWNEEVDSLHKTFCEGEDCGPTLGPHGLLVNKIKDIYIFDRDRNGEGWGTKRYN